MGLFSLEKAQHDVIDVSEYVMWWNKESGARLLAVHSERMRGNGHKLKYRKMHLGKRKNVWLCSRSNSRTGCPEKMWSLHPWM